MAWVRCLQGQMHVHNAFELEHDSLQSITHWQNAAATEQQ
jgi:hypothetical protein